MRRAHFAGDLRTAEVLEAASRAPQAPPAKRPRIAETLIRVGAVARNKWDRVRARACYDEAAKILAGAGPEWEPLRASLDQAEASWLRAVDTDAAIARYQRALERRRRCLRSPSYPIADNLTWLGHAASGTRVNDAHGWLAEAQQELRALGLEASTLNAVIEGHLAGDKGGWVELESRLRAAATIFANARPLQLPGYARRSCPLDGYEALATAALHQGRFEEAWRLVERARGATHVDFAVLGLWRDEEPTTYRMVRALRKDLLEARDRLDRERTRVGQAWAATTWRLLMKTLELRAAIDRKEADYLRLHRPAEPSLTDVRKLLDSRSALVGWLVGVLSDSDAWAYVVRQSGPVVWKRLEPPRIGPVGTDKGWAMIGWASAWPLRVEFDTEIAEALRSWTALMVDPLLPELDGIEHLIVEQSSWFPIEAGIDDSGRFLGDRFDVTYVPSALHAVLTARRNRSRARREVASALAIAGPMAPAPNGWRRSLGERDDVLRVLRSSFPRQARGSENAPPPRRARSGSVALGFPRRRCSKRPPAPRASEGFGRRPPAGSTSSSRPIPSPTRAERCGLPLGTRQSTQSGRWDSRPRGDRAGMGLDAGLLTLSGWETGLAAGVWRGEGSASRSAARFGRPPGPDEPWPVEDRSTALSRTVSTAI